MPCRASLRTGSDRSGPANSLAQWWGLYDLEHVRNEATEFAIEEARRIYAERQAQLEREATSAGDVPDAQPPTNGPYDET
jgi:hypothetical protein